jgi:hypothetical protein
LELRLVFAGCVRLDGKGVNAIRQILRQHRIYHAMAFDPALSFERIRYDIDPEMRFAAGPVAGVAFMQMGLIGDVEAFGNESFVQLFCDVIFDGHHPRNIARYSRRSMAVSIAIHRHSDV